MLRYAQSAGRVALAGDTHRHNADGCFKPLARTWAGAMEGPSSADAPEKLSKRSTGGLVRTHFTTITINAI
jgi:hypothetical protein